MHQVSDWLTRHLLQRLEYNAFVQLLEIRLSELALGKVTMFMPVKPDKHTNLFGVAHGGAVASLADVVMGIACATHGNRIVTIELNINYIKNGQSKSDLYATGSVIHAGRQTMVAEGEIYDNQRVLLAKARGTFFVTGRFEE